MAFLVRLGYKYHLSMFRRSQMAVYAGSQLPIPMHSVKLAKLARVGNLTSDRSRAIPYINISPLPSLQERCNVVQQEFTMQKTNSNRIVALDTPFKTDVFPGLPCSPHVHLQGMTVQARTVATRQFRCCHHIHLRKAVSVSSIKCIVAIRTGHLINRPSPTTTR